MLCIQACIHGYVYTAWVNEEGMNCGVKSSLSFGFIRSCVCAWLCAGKVYVCSSLQFTRSVLFRSQIMFSIPLFFAWMSSSVHLTRGGWLVYKWLLKRMKGKVWMAVLRSVWNLVIGWSIGDAICDKTAEDILYKCEVSHMYKYENPVKCVPNLRSGFTFDFRLLKFLMCFWFQQFVCLCIWV